jgi:8-oxo-dGTP diphosphatase
MPISPAAIGIVFNTDKTKVLLVKRKDISVWVLPGGGIESGETDEEAVVREIQEETGFLVQIERKCAEYIPVNRLATFTSVFVCFIQGGTPYLTSEVSDIHFYPLNQLPSSFFIIHRDWLTDALNSSELVKKPLNNVTYFRLFKYLIRHPFHVIRYALTRSRSQ